MLNQFYWIESLQNVEVGVEQWLEFATLSIATSTIIVLAALSSEIAFTHEGCTLFMNFTDEKKWGSLHSTQ